jgi:hypothetical protein
MLAVIRERETEREEEPKCSKKVLPCATLSTVHLLSMISLRPDHITRARARARARVTRYARE